MSYSIYRTDGTLLTNIPDGVVNTVSTSLQLPGRNYSSYGVVVDTNFVHILENFANDTVPLHPMRGQLWFNTTDNSLYMCPTAGETNQNNWIKLLSATDTDIETVNIIATGNIEANNVSVDNQLTSDVVTANHLTVNIDANISNANLSGTTSVDLLNTDAITTGSAGTSGNITGSWNVIGNLQIPSGNLTVANILTDNYKWANGQSVLFGRAGGSENQVQYNLGGELKGSPSFTFDPALSNLDINANVNAVNFYITSGSYYGNAAGITNIPAGNTVGTLSSAVQGNITQVGTLSGLIVSGNSAITGNVTITGNVSATGITGTLTTASQPNITSVGTLSSLSVSGNIVTSNLKVNTSANITGNIVSSGNVTLTGANISLGQIANVKISGGISGFILTTDGSGNLSFVDPSTLSALPAGSNTQIQFNDNGISLGASAGLTFNKVTGNLNVASSINASALYASSNVTTVGFTSTTANVTGDASIGGNLAINSNLSVNLSANFGGGLIANGLSQLKGGANVSGDLNSLSGNVNVLLGRFNGNGAGITNINGANVSKVANAINADTVTTLTSPQIITALGFTPYNAANPSGFVTSSGSVNYANTSGTTNSVAWTSVSGRPTAVSAFTNDAGYITTPFPSGTRMTFQQTSAPTGWTKITTYDNAALRVVSGSVGTGGAVDFTTAFSNKTVSGTVDYTALTVGQLPGHSHYVAQHSDSTIALSGSPSSRLASYGAYGGNERYLLSASTGGPDVGVTSQVGEGQPHNHTFSGSSINLAVKYVDVIIAQKD